MNESITTFIPTLMKQLAPIYEHPEEQEQVAWWMLEAIKNQSHAQLFAQGTLELSPQEEATLATWIKEHTQDKKPLQYILGSVPFNNLTLNVEPPVLIPRPETEEWVFNLCTELQSAHLSDLKILDIGCGSGAIALSLAQALPESIVYAIDIAEHAEKLTRTNAELNALTNIIIMQSDCFDALPKERTFDLIVSNPPYISTDEYKQLEPMVSQWEDKQALVAEHHGLAIIEKIIQQAPLYLTDNDAMKRKGIAQLYIEIGYRQGDAVKELLCRNGYTAIKILKDLEGKDRVATARFER